MTVASAYLASSSNSPCWPGVQEGVPLRLDMWGVNLYTGGHFDRYIADYHGFEPGPAPAKTFAIPEYCPQHPTAVDAYIMRHQMAQNGLLRHLYAMLPNQHSGIPLLSSSGIQTGHARV